MKEIISSLDIGSSTVKVVVGEMYKDELNVLSASEVKSKGIKRGIIVNPEEALISIKEAFNRTEDMLGIKVNKVILTVPSYYAEFLVVDGEIEVKNENGIVGSKEVISVLQSCVYNKVPNNREVLESLPGVGRKTTNVVLGMLYDEPCIPVDTHVERVSKRLGLADYSDSVLEVEEKLNRLIPDNKKMRLHHQLLLFGRYYCKAKNPLCDSCRLKKICKKTSN